ncbi:MAG: hypothetical protein ABIK07_13600, partial [Planctomycetota bacterium]
MSKQTADILLVINQDVSIRTIETVLRRHRPASLVLLTTHHLFAKEHQMLAAVAPESFRIITFAELLSDAEMQACDDLASETLRRTYISDKAVRLEYGSRFSDLCLQIKNENVYQKVADRFDIRRIVYGSGLGIHTAVWQSAGGRSIDHYRRLSCIFHRIKTAAQFLIRMIRFPVTCVTFGDIFFTVFAPEEGLRFPREAVVEKRTVNLLGFVRPGIGRNSRPELKRRIAARFKPPQKS